MPARRSTPHASIALAVAVIAITWGPWTSAPLTAAQPAAPLCAPGLTMVEIAARAAAPDAPPADTLRQWAVADDRATRGCGVRALAATRDHETAAAVAAALRRSDARDDAWLVARWAAFAAGGSDAAASAAFAPVIDVLRDPAAARAAGVDGVRLLGEIDVTPAREALLAHLATDDRPETTDAAIHALARQGEARARARVVALAQTVMNGLGGNATFEEARRLGAAAFYLLALGPDTRDDGLRLLTRLAPADQADAGAWAAQTLCERAVRRPPEAAAHAATRAALVDALDQRGIAWASLIRGTFRCPAAP